MFTGLVESLGKVVAIVPEPPGVRLVIEAAGIAADAALGAHRVAEYDALRLARFLSTETFVTVASLARSAAVAGVLERPLLAVVAAYPRHFEYVPPGGAVPGGALVGDVLRDQIFLMRRCGFDSFALRPDRPAGAAASALHDFRHVYQQATIDPETPILARHR